MNVKDKLQTMLKKADELINDSPEEALKLYTNAKELASTKKDILSLASITKGICHYYFLKEDFERSDTIFTEAIDILLKDSDKETAWRWHNWYAYKYMKYGNLEKALEYFEISLKINKELNNQQQIAGLLGNIAYLYIKTGKFTEAKDLLKESVTIQEYIEDFIGLTRSYNQLAELYYRTADTKRALELYFRAAEYLEKDVSEDKKENITLSAVISNNIANIYKKLDDLPNALIHYKKSLKAKELLKAETRIPITLCNIAIIYKNMKEYDTSLEYYHRALELCRKLNLRTQESKVYLNLGTLYFAMNNPEKALKYYQKAEEIKRTVNDPYALTKVLINISNIHISKGEFDIAEKYLEEASDLSQKFDFPDEERDIYRNYVQINDGLNDAAGSNLYRKKLIEINEKLFERDYAEDLAEMKTKYDTDLKEKEAEIYRLKTIDLENKNKEINKQKLALEKTLEDLRRSEINYSFAAKELKRTIGTTIVGESVQIKKIINLISKVAETTKTTVLITGESGTGKELIARAIHDFSTRKEGNFCAVNVSSIPESLFESEFFGYKKNAFTGADKDKPGWFEIADKGTLFLDEIGTLPHNLQIKLLRVLEEKKVVRIGSNKEIDVDVRIVSATNSKLLKMVEDDSFRSDLYHRLSAFVINLPPLRERISDIPLLLEHFVKLFCKQMNRQITTVERKAEALLLSYDFPGNIRELKNLIERAIIMSNSSTLKSEHFSIPQLNSETDCNEKIIPLEKLEKQMLIKALKATGFHQAKAAKLLEIQPKAIERRMIKYGIKKV